MASHLQLYPKRVVALTPIDNNRLCAGNPCLLVDAKRPRGEISKASIRVGTALLADAPVQRFQRA